MKRIKESWLQAKNRWSHFSLRDKKAIILLGSVFFVYIFFALIWVPILHHVADMRKQVSANQQLLAWMEAADKTIVELKKTEHTRAKPDSLVAFLSIIKKGVEAAGLTKSMSQLRQAGNDTIELHFQNVNFDQAIRFYSDILQTYDVHLSHFSVSALSTPGTTNIDLVLRVNVA